MLKFANIHLALVLPNQHPEHFAITREDIVPFGTPFPHRDGTSSVYIHDPDGNHIEMLQLAETGWEKLSMSSQNADERRGILFFDTSIFLNANRLMI